MVSFTPLQDIGEFGLIERIQKLLGKNYHNAPIKAIGDDCAVYPVSEELFHLITTDALIEGVHFDRTFMPLRYLGFKALSVNISDVFAMNGKPLFATLALGIPQNISVEMIDELYQGIHQACNLYEVDLIGGDITASRQLTLSLTVVGEVSQNKISYRSGAQAGDAICVSGDIGAAYAGLKVLTDFQKRFAKDNEEVGEQPDLTPFDYVIQRNMVPTARRDVLLEWQNMNIVPTACIDISDGLASEIHHVAKQSNCGAFIYEHRLPISIPTREVATLFGEEVETYALFGGEDYELLFTLPEKFAYIQSELFTVIGEIRPPEEGVHMFFPDGSSMPIESSGFTHF